MEMKKKLLLLALLVLCLPAFLFAQRVIDNAGLLNASEKAELENRLAVIASEYYFDLVIVTENNIGNTQAGDYADNFYDRGGYGEDGALFLQVAGSYAEDREYWFSTSGSGVKILNSTAYGKLESDVLKFLRNDDPAGAYRSFIDDWELFLSLDAKGGRSYNFFYKWNAVLVIIAWVLALLIGFLVVQSWKAQMNTALPQKQADPYVVSGSLAFTDKKESFLYSNVKKTKRESSSSSSGTGSLISSSGRRHSGRGGKY
jgi:uncharacterized protein